MFEELKRACQRRFVIPFVGAGMSKSAGLPEWREYLLSKCGDAGLEPSVPWKSGWKQRPNTKRYDDRDRGETHAANVFERDFERNFSPAG